MSKALSFLFRSLLVFGLSGLASHSLFATHLRAGEITATRLNCASYTYRICITIYVKTLPDHSEVKFGGGDLLFGDGAFHVTEQRNSTPFGDPLDYIGVVNYCVDYTYPATGVYHISYNEKNRNAEIRNIDGSVNISFFLETTIEIDPFKGCNNSPRLLVPPIDKACSGVTWQHNPGAYDIDGDSLSYKMTIPRYVPGDGLGPVLPVPGYTLPNDPVHYTNLDYENAQEDDSGRPTFSIDQDGTITWDSPGAPGEYNIAFLVIGWRKVNDVWLITDSLTRDMQIFVEDCPNDNPVLEVPQDICVVAGEVISEDIFGTDPNFDPVKIEAFSQTLILPVSPATYTPKSSIVPLVEVWQSTTPPNKAKVTYTWQTKCDHIKQQPYQVVFKITDNPTNGGVRLSSFATWNITVVGPQPVWDEAVAIKRDTVKLKWNTYDCNLRADSMQIWRRVDSVEYVLDTCLTGMPPGLGFTKIKTVPINQTSYFDTNNGKGMPPGATWCYRLVAQFPAPFGNTEGGAESLVSEEVCVGPFLVDAPIMTNVTIDTTNREKGEITVRWVPPFESTIPPPYHYKVYRALGFSGDAGLTLVKTKKWPTGVVDSTFVVDSLLNTFDNVYNYRVFAYDASETLIDTSAIASSVRLQAKSLLEKIELSWTADVPWSLHSSLNPLHVIYRGGENDTEGQFVKIDSIESTGGILMFTDEGLMENQKYCYRVETRGGYGYDDLSKIPEPLINFSQIVCAQPSDNKPPCKPEVVLEVLDCDEYYNTYGCSFNDFSNVLRWNRPADDACRDDISHYRIYYATKANTDTADYELLVDLEDHATDTSYVDRNLPSFARCYRLVAVDRSGNESSFSNEVCNDNCPNYNLPNVFTPGNGDDCNDFFSAFNDRGIVNGKLLCGNIPASSETVTEMRNLCPRFVQRVEVVIVDRWGKQVFKYASGGENTIYIDWDGRDDNGKELSSGIYYYSARVTFETLDPKDSEKIIKGWVQLVRTE